MFLFLLLFIFETDHANKLDCNLKDLEMKLVSEERVLEFLELEMKYVQSELSETLDSHQYLEDMMRCISKKISKNYLKLTELRKEIIIVIDETEKKHMETQIVLIEEDLFFLNKELNELRAYLLNKSGPKIRRLDLKTNELRSQVNNVVNDIKRVRNEMERVGSEREIES